MDKEKGEWIEIATRYRVVKTLQTWYELKQEVSEF